MLWTDLEWKSSPEILWDSSKAVWRGNFIALNSYIFKKEELDFCIKLEKE